MEDKKTIFVDVILFTDKNKVSSKVDVTENKISWINNAPPKFIMYNGKLWRNTGMGLSAYFYHEEESFVKI